MFMALLTVLTPLVGSWCVGAVGRAYFHEKVEMPVYVANVMILIFISSIVVLTLVVSCSSPIGELFSLSSGWLLAAVFVAMSFTIVYLKLTLWQVSKEPVRYGVFQNSQTLTEICISLVLVVALGMNWQGRVLGITSSAGIFCALALLLLYKSGGIKLKIETEYMRHALKFGLPLIPHMLSGVVLTATDRIFISRLVGIADTGLYVIGYQIGMIILLIQDSFNRAYVPWLFEKLTKGGENEKHRIVKLTYLYFICIILMALCLGISAPWILKVMAAKAFAGSHVFVVWIALGFAFNGMYKMVANYIFYAEKTHFMSIISVTCALINIVLSYALIKLYGAIGAAYAMVIVSFVFFLLTWIISSRIYPMPWVSVFKVVKR